MHLLSQQVLGILIVLLLVMLVVVKRAATGSILETPKGGSLLWLVNIFNLLFLLVINPLAAILLLMEKINMVDPSFLTITNGPVLILLETAGLIMYLFGFLLMAWALIILGRNYQLGGVDPRATDKMVFNGPYTYLRHPMYTAALSIALGLACLIQSLACFVAFSLYLVLIVLLIPYEEESLVKAYGETYIQYKQKVRRLLPFY
jgi:protein-S-isoprenylcysteine O-methyltransferase Ste14